MSKNTPLPKYWSQRRLSPQYELLCRVQVELPFEIAALRWYRIVIKDCFSFRWEEVRVMVERFVEFVCIKIVYVDCEYIDLVCLFLNRPHLPFFIQFPISWSASQGKELCCVCRIGTSHIDTPVGSGSKPEL